MTRWKKLFSQHLLSTARSVNTNLNQQNIQYLIDIPKTFHTEKQMIDFSMEINKCIQFPHLLYISKQKR